MERDPFQPYGSAPATTAAAPAAVDDSVKSHESMVAYPLDSFRVVGVIVAPDQSLAAVQARDAKDYIIAVGDAMGREGGKVSAISKDGITVKLGEDKIDIPVSNKMEKANDKDK